MDFASHPGVDWKALFRLTGFRYYFAGMFISLFGTGMNFAGVTWYILAETNSTVKVSLITILVDRKSTRLNSSHLVISYAVFCLKKKKKKENIPQQKQCHK